MTSENEGFDAGAMYDEGMTEAGLDPENTTVIEDNIEVEEAGSISQVDDSKGTSDEPKTEQAETKSESETKDKKAADSSAEDIESAIKSTEKQAAEEPEPDSVIESLLPKFEQAESAEEAEIDRTGKYVPVESHIKLRERAQKAEQERDELKARLEATPTGGEKPGKAEKSPLEKYVEENPDDDFIPAKVQLEERNFQEAKRQAVIDAQRKAEQERLEAAEKQKRQADAIRSIGRKALKSEIEFRKTAADYNEVVLPFVKANLLTNEERLDFLKNENPAKRLYEICKAKRESYSQIIGITPKQEKPSQTKASTTENAQTTQEEGGDLTDDEIFNEVKDLLPAGGEEF
jgi:hypothetical protein